MINHTNFNQFMLSDSKQKSRKGRGQFGSFSGGSLCSVLELNHTLFLGGQFTPFLGGQFDRFFHPFPKDE